MKTNFASFALLALGAITLASCDNKPTVPTSELLVEATQPGAEIKNTMYGIFFEDINYAADGGLKFAMTVHSTAIHITYASPIQVTYTSAPVLRTKAFSVLPPRPMKSIV